MKIAIIGPAHPYRGGLAIYNERMAEEFQKEGHHVTLYTFTLQYPSLLFPGKTQYASNKEKPNLNVIRCINSINPINWIKIGNRIKNEKPDIVIIKYWLPFMGPCYGTILRMIKKNGHSKIITIVDNMIPHESRIGDKVFSEYFVKPVDGFLAMSDKVLQDIQLFDNQKPKVLTPHPLFDNFGSMISREAALNELDLDPDYRYILFFGFIRKYKGLDLLLHAFADERFRTQKIKLIIAGEYYSNKEMYKKIINDHGIQDQLIQIERFIQDSEVKNFFCASDLVVQPYKSATQSGVTQIAYHFDKPMIVTNVGGLPELCPHGKVGYVVPPEPQAISDAMIDFFEESDQQKFIDNIKIEKKKYSWAILVQKIITLTTEIEQPSKSPHEVH